MRDANVQWVLGGEEVRVSPMPPYSDLVVEFLNDVSGALRKKAAGGRYADVVSLAFWCRKSNILQLKEQAKDGECRLGRGLVFHITPSNVPVNFAFSYFFGLLAGNANVVRLPSRQYPQVDQICTAIREVLQKPDYETLRAGTAFVRYGHDQDVTDQLSANADARIIWGGDEAIRTIRRSSMKPKSVEIVFADRYSLGVLSSEAVLDAADAEMARLAKQFYNDTYLMDQNACSTPHLLLWMGSGCSEAKQRFWEAVFAETKNYDLEAIKAVDKYTDLCMAAMQEQSGIATLTRWGNALYTIGLKQLPDDMTQLRGRFGMFYEYEPSSLQELSGHVTERVQTLLYYGMDRQKLQEFVIGGHLRGIDRIVPFGSSLDMNVYWDGYDIVGQLSRRIEVR